MLGEDASEKANPSRGGGAKSRVCIEQTARLPKGFFPGHLAVFFAKEVKFYRVVVGFDPWKKSDWQVH